MKAADYRAAIAKATEFAMTEAPTDADRRARLFSLYLAARLERGGDQVSSKALQRLNALKQHPELSDQDAQ